MLVPFRKSYTPNYPAGTYGAQTFTSESSVSILGAGIDSTIFQADSSDNIITINGCDVVEIAYCTIQGNYSRQSGGYYTQMGLRFVGTNPSVYVHHVKIVDCSFVGIINDVGAALTGTFSHLDISHCGDFGIQFRSGATNVSVLDSDFATFASRQYPGHGIYYDDVNGGLIARNTVSGLPTAVGMGDISGIKVTRETDTANTGITVEDCTVDNAVCAVSLPYAKNVLVQRCVGTNIITRGYYLLVGGDNLDINDCSVDGATYGFTYYDALPTNSSITNCTATNCGTQCNIPAESVTQTGNSWNV